MNNLGLLRTLVICFSLVLTAVQTVEAKSLRHVRRAAQQASRASVKSPKAVQHLTRSARKAQRLALRTKIQEGMPATAALVKRLPWDPELKIQEIFQISPAPRSFLPQIWDIQQEYGNHNLIALTAKRYYKEHFGLLTPHLHRLFDKIASFQLPQLERRFFTRMQFLAENKQFIVPKLSRAVIKPGNIRMRYVTDVGQLTP